MGWKRQVRKLARYQYKIHKLRAKSELKRTRGRLAKAGKLEGKAQQIELKMERRRARLAEAYRATLTQADAARAVGKAARVARLENRARKMSRLLGEGLPEPRAAAAESPAPTFIIRETTREVVKIPCAYCDTLNDHLLSKCPSCGATLK